jgi:anti-sigma factor RsiW
MRNNPENCKEVFAMLSEYLDLELPREACSEIEKHLAGCAPCTEFVESLRKTVALCRNYRPGAIPAPLTVAARTELETAWRRMLKRRSGKHTPETQRKSSIF